MTTSGDRGKPPVRLGLDVLSCFDDANAPLDGDAIARLTGLSSSTAQRCLVDLSRFGCIVAVEDGGYTLAGNRVGQVRCSGGSSASASA